MKKVHFTDHSRNYLRDGLEPRTALTAKDIEDILLNNKYVTFGNKKRRHYEVAFCLAYDFLTKTFIVIIVDKSTENLVRVISIQRSNFEFTVGVNPPKDEDYMMAKELSE